MTDALKDLFKAATDRLDSPVAGPFTLIWLIWHWQLPVLLIFGSPNLERIAAIQGYLDQQSYLSLLAYPALLTMAYIPTILFFRVCYNWISTYVLYWIQRRNESIDKKLTQERDYGATLFDLNRFLFERASMGRTQLERIQEEANETLKNKNSPEELKQSLKDIHTIARESAKDLGNTLYSFDVFHNDQSKYIDEQLELLGVLHMRSFSAKIRAITKIIRH
ncbi:hypothetical protein ACNH6C_13735 [Bdellovibrio bacteriovorus]|uniref:hypothetical protein n=1 Tax=Bdellovibrio bacteriovorus TaxID=959 RepID=UPI003A7F93A0